MTIKEVKTIYFIYNADGGLLNEIKYWINKNLLRKEMVCELCDISHSKIFVRYEWTKFIKELRIERLKATDWYSNSDVTMPENIKTWRQQLRDLPQTYTTEAEYDELLEMQGEFPNQTLKHTVWSKP